jgi:hypothetical protein
MKIVADIVQGLTAPVATYFTRRAELKAQKYENEMKILIAQGERQAALAMQGMTADANWEMEFARQAATSWKDEAVLVILSIPLVMAFVPGMDVFVAKGFAAFAGTPLWYQVMVQAVFYATYGIRAFNKFRSDT